MRYYFFLLVICLTSLTVNANDTTLHAGVYRNSDNTFTLRWNTNDKTLTTSPRVVGLGSSTLAGYLLSYPDRLGDKISAWLSANTSGSTWINLAVAGYASANLMPTTLGGTTGKNIDSALNSNPDFIFISLPTNDVANGLTNAAIMANFRYLDGLALNSGVPIFWETTQPRTTFNATLQTQLKVLADSIRAAWPNRYVEGFIPVVNTTASTDAAINSIYDAGDGVHLNTTGNQFIADSLFARWKNYFQPVTGVYIIETSADGTTWSTFDTVTNTVKKTYINTFTATQYFRVRSESAAAYSNIVSLTPASSPGNIKVRNTNRILVDLGGDGVNTVLPNGTAIGQPTASPDAFGNYWNNWYGSGGSAGFKDGATITQLITTADSATTISMKIIGTPDGTYNTSSTTRAINNNGFSAGIGDYPSTALSDNMFLYNSINPNGIILRIKGLAKNSTYNFKLWGARLDAVTTPRILETRLAAEDWTAAKNIETRYGTSASPDYDRAINYTGITGVDSLDIYLRVGTGSTFASLSLVDISFGRTDTVTVCEGANTTLTAGRNAGTYQWQQNTGSGYVNVSGATSATLTLTKVLPAWSGYRFRCLADNDSSNIHHLLVKSSATPSITISGTTSVRQYVSTSLRAVITNGGSTPFYQWMDSTNTHTWSDINEASAEALTYTPKKTGDKLLCQLTSSLAGCLTATTVSSNQLSFKVDVITAVDPDPSTNTGPRIYPNPAGASITIDQLSNWKTMEIHSLDGKTYLKRDDMLTKTSITLSISHLPNGVYLLALTKANGTTSSIKFVKAD
ncbi:GDSL-type esterase/lipase family protein [Chitinophaga sancti]|uniref:T9SS type A sorting domain-containing protein n=1 Tax=Chitinophaga sancti TaxID=1004 RepID=UPI003F798F57